MTLFARNAYKQGILVVKFLSNLSKKCKVIKNHNMIPKKQFRAWVESQKYMAYQGSPDLETIESFMHHFSGRVLMERSNFQSIDSKYIFEGDILSEKYKAEVYRDNNGAFCVRFHVNPKINKPMLLAAFIYTRKRAGTFDRDGVIIGNIFESSKPLKQS